MSHRELIISGHTFSVPVPYAEGHTINAAEAHTLNQTRVENVRNNLNGRFAKAVKEHGAAIPAEHLDTLLTEGQAYAHEYTFNGTSRLGPRANLNPVESAAHKIAKELIAAHLRQKKIAIKDLPEGKLEELVKSLLERRPDITEEAQRRVDAAKSLGTQLLEGLEEAPAIEASEVPHPKKSHKGEVAA
jgi:hypothetical protein